MFAAVAVSLDVVDPPTCTSSWHRICAADTTGELCFYACDVEKETS
ncbi:hypothetical protein HMPREF0591_5579 [Mycobacterium parascrofulaceum ATCC BAA-614]|uniref:Uncharacterized protein n=1 Tax=Mycobacterium parascrofulaceum ATCC BAA-614 TaxID=525368 RepID=D5PHD5_9MYCO|nr:hypothetical protein HMPREF0591_5579 [Mycobacterium parascrofulaceum ATCC BAA-614]